MAQRPIEQYRGKLTAEEVAAGINAALRNARRLVSDARILLEGARYPSAASLAALAIEEAGKVSILRALALANSASDLAAAWKDYRSHRAKNAHWIIKDLAAKGARYLQDLSEAVNRNGEHTAILDTVKQLGFYTDCYGDRHWSIPDEVINADLTKGLVEIAELLARGNEVTSREIDLWVEHLGPAWNTKEMPHALVRWARAMEHEGLGRFSAAEMAQFVFGEPELKVDPPNLPQKQ